MCIVPYISVTQLVCAVFCSTPELSLLLKMLLFCFYFLQKTGYGNPKKGKQRKSLV